MPKRTFIDLASLKQMRAAGLSHQRLADHFEVCKSTIKRLLRAREPDQEVLEFTRKLTKLLEEVPNDYCRKEMLRAINFMRTHQAQPPAKKYNLILKSIKSGAREIGEIGEDCHLSEAETGELLGDLLALGKVEKRERGGTFNCGRKMKYHYYPANQTMPAEAPNRTF